MKLTGNIRLSDEKCLALLYGLSNHAENHYTLRKIPKRTGGFRILHEPDPLLKYIQRQILRRVFVPAVRIRMRPCLRQWNFSQRKCTSPCRKRKDSEAGYS